jgi:localization factor PodJL
MTYRNFEPENLNAGRVRRQTNFGQQQNQDSLMNSFARGSAITDLTRELEAIANELGRLKSTPAPATRAAHNHGLAQQTTIDSDQLNMLVQSLKNDVRKQMRDDLDAQYIRLREELDGLNAAIAGTALQNSFKGEIAALLSGLETLASGNRTIQNSQDKLSDYLQRELSDLQSSLNGLARNESLAKLDDRWNSLENRWNRLEDRLDHGLNTDSSAYFSDISSRISALHDKMNDGGLESLENRLLMLAKSVDSLAQNRASGAASDFSQIEKRFDELSRAVAAIGTERAAPTIDTQAIDQIEKAIGLLARKIETIGNVTGQNPALDAIETRLGQLSDRFANLPDYFNQEPVMERIDRLAEKVSALPSPLLSPASIDALTQQLNLLAGEIRGNVAGYSAPEGMFDRLDDRLGSIEERLQRLSFNDSQPMTQDSDAVILALERRFSELSAHLQAMQPVQGSASGSDLSAVERQLADISRQLMQTSKPASDAVLAALEQRFSELSAHLQAMQPAQVSASGADLSAVERQLADISRQLMQAPEPAMHPVYFERLENQIADLSLMLTRQPANGGEAFAARFESLEDLLSKNQHVVLEAARKAAEEAASRYQSSGVETDHSKIVDVIAGELATLEQLTRNSNERSTTAFEGIHGALTKIADRLAALETKPAAAFAAPAAAQPYVNAQQQVDSFRAAQAAAPLGEEAFFVPSVEASEGDIGKFDVRSEPGNRKARSPSEMAQEAANAALRNNDSQNSDITGPAMQHGQFDDTPINPGANVPDLNSILKRVRDQKKAAQSQVAKDVDRKDHFMSIKRAAQAAAAEVQHVPTKSNAGGVIGNAKEIFAKFRRPILVVAAAAVVAIAALQLSSALFSGDAEQIQETELQLQEQPVEGSVDANGSDLASNQASNIESDLSTSENGEASPRVIDVAPLEANSAEEAGGTELTSDPINAPVEADTASPEANATSAELAVPADFGPEPLVEAAKNNDMKAQFELARRLAEKQNSASAQANAFAWFNAAAAQGFAPAQYRVGNMYEKGLGVERSASNAKLWYQMAAEAGNASAMHNLAVLFASGADGSVDSASALRWFQKAADLGVGDSQFNLGVMKGKGQGVPQDLEESYKWLAILAKSGDAEAAAKRDEVAKTMRPDQLDSAKAKVELWKPKTVVLEANDVTIPEDWKIAGEATASVDVKKAVKNVQMILSKLGYKIGTPDGVMGENTRKAIRAFQAKEKLAVTGDIDAPLVKALLAKNR